MVMHFKNSIESGLAFDSFYGYINHIDHFEDVFSSHQKLAFYSLTYKDHFNRSERYTFDDSFVARVAFRIVACLIPVKEDLLSNCSRKTSQSFEFTSYGILNQDCVKIPKPELNRCINIESSDVYLSSFVFGDWLNNPA